MAVRHVTLIGSSPLARGLPLVAAPIACSMGIIPARAGFTTHTTPHVPCFGDHPRSRGVYFRPLYQPTSYAGSSPLARGLPPTPISIPPRERIIPARAGFTLGVRLTGVKRRDHPRSRGVYGLPGRQVMHGEGSSPLARGLPREIATHRCTVKDHPRSRGVYGYPVLYASLFGGSSPLARGLPCPNPSSGP